MKRDEDKTIDPRFHAYLDGELSASETAAFEADLRPGTSTENQVRLLTHLGAWFRDTRPRAPSSLARGVEEALQAEIRPRPAASSWKSLPGLFRWVWIPAAAAVIVVLSIIPEGRVPTRTGDVPQSSDRLVTPVSDTGNNVAPEPGGHTVQHVFTVKAADAGRVCLAGDFNEWKVCEAPLERAGGDTWTITIELPPGRHEYMFVIDDQWVTDPNAMGYSDDGFGNRNAVLVV